MGFFQPHKQLKRSAAALSLLWLLVSPPAWAGLENILLEKGVLSKEEYDKLKAEEEGDDKRKAETQQPLAEKLAEKLAKDKEQSLIETLHKEFPVKTTYGSKGLEFSTRDGRFKMQIQSRFQFRYSFPTDDDPRNADGGFDNSQASSFNIRRARLKVGGHAYQPWLKTSFQFDYPSARLLDFRLTIAKFKWLQLEVGQGKIHFNRERVDSSGKQQFVERSIVNREFTVDRQQGAELSGHLFPGTFAHSRYWLGVYNGTGRGKTNDDKNMMYLGRFQWNFLGRDVPFSQSDVEFHEQPIGSIAWAGVTNISECTRFSSGGCGNLDGFAKPANAKSGQFRIDQMVEEFAFKWRGFSVQQEFHWKRIKDSVNDNETNLRGSVAQVGYFFHHLVPFVPRNLETAFRYAFVDPNTSRSNDVRREATVALNYFIAGHANKLTLDASHLSEEQPVGSNLTEQRIRLQWDISF